MIALREVESDADLQQWIAVRRHVLPDEPATTIEQMQALETPERLLLLAARDGELAGSGLATRSDTGGAFVIPRVLPQHRRGGVGTALLDPLLEHVRERGFEIAVTRTESDGAREFAEKHGFTEIDRQVEQVREISPDEPEPAPFDGLEFTSVEERPELLERAFAIGEQGYADLVLANRTMRPVPLEEWLRDEATLPGGSIVALDGERVVGYAGLLSWNDDDTRAENGLTAVDRAWRRRGLATALKRRQIAWAAANGIRELITWTQTGNEGMRIVNEGLGYVTRTVSLTMRRELVRGSREQ